jgi:hypothetical protein
VREVLPAFEQLELLAPQEGLLVQVPELQEPQVRQQRALVQLVQALELNLMHRLIQDVHQLQQLYQLQHQLLEEFQQLVMESLYRPYL